MSTPASPVPYSSASFKHMDFSHKARWRSIFSRGMDALVGLLALAAIIPLISVIYMVVERGAGNFRWSMLWELPPAAGMEGGGFGNALLGTTTVRLKALE